MYMRQRELRLVGAGAASGDTASVQMEVEHAASGAAALMRFTAREEGGQLEEVEAAWEGRNLSAPVECAEDLVFLGATIFGCNARSSALWLAAPCRRISGAEAAESQLPAGSSSGSRRLCADSAARLWQELEAGCRQGRVLVVADAEVDAAELAVDRRRHAARGPHAQVREQPARAQEAGVEDGVLLTHRDARHGRARGEQAWSAGSDGGDDRPPMAGAVRKAEAGAEAGAGSGSAASLAAPDGENEACDVGACSVDADDGEVGASAWAQEGGRARVRAEEGDCPARRLRCKIRHEQTGRWQRLLVEVHAPQVSRSLSRIAPGDAVDVDGGIVGGSDGAGRVRVIWDGGKGKGKAAFNLTRLGDLTVFASRLLRLDAGEHAIFLASDASCGEEVSPSVRRRLSNSMQPQEFGRLVCNRTAGAGGDVLLLLARRGAGARLHAADSWRLATPGPLYERHGSDARVDPLPVLMSLRTRPLEACLAVGMSSQVADQMHRAAACCQEQQHDAHVFRGRIWCCAPTDEHGVLGVQTKTRLEWTHGALAVEVKDRTVVEDVCSPLLYIHTPYALTLYPLVACPFLTDDAPVYPWLYTGGQARRACAGSGGREVLPGARHSDRPITSCATSRRQTRQPGRLAASARAVPVRPAAAGSVFRARRQMHDAARCLSCLCL